MLNQSGVSEKLLFGEVLYQNCFASSADIFLWFFTCSNQSRKLPVNCLTDEGEVDDFTACRMLAVKMLWTAFFGCCSFTNILRSVRDHLAIILHDKFLIAERKISKGLIKRKDATCFCRLWLLVFALSVYFSYTKTSLLLLNFFPLKEELPERGTCIAAFTSQWGLYWIWTFLGF